MHKEITYLCARASKRRGINGFKVGCVDLHGDFVPQGRAGLWIKNL